MVHLGTDPDHKWSGVSSSYPAPKGHLDVAGSVLSICAPLVSQTPETGMDRKTLLWHSCWVLFRISINNCYLGTLSSITVLLEIRVANLSFRSLLEKKFSFTANEDAWFRLKNDFAYDTDGNVSASSQRHKHLPANTSRR